MADCDPSDDRPCATVTAPPMAGALDVLELMEGLDVGVVVQGADAEILYANELALELLGRSREQILGLSSFDPVWDVVRPDGSPFPPAERPVAQVLERRAPVKDVVMGVRRRNGERAWILANAMPRFGVGPPDAAPVRQVVITLSDISSERRRMGLLQQVKDELEAAVTSRTAELAASVTKLEREVAERRRVESALARSESMYRSVLRAMAEGVAIHATDGSIEYVNPAAQRVLGLSEDQLLGRVAIDPTWSLIDGDGAPLPADAIPSEITRRTGEPVSKRLLGVTRPDGDRRWLEVSTEPVPAPNTDATSAAPPRVVATFTDVTAARAARDALERGRARFERVTETVPGVLYQMRISPGGPLEVTFVSARVREVLGLEPEAVVADASRIRERVHPEDLERFRSSFRLACAGPSTWECDFRVRDARGEWRWLRNRGDPEDLGDAIGWSGLITDVTEEFSLAEQVQVAQRREAIGAVTAGIAHNFNNALAVLVPNLEQCLVDAPPKLHAPLDESLRTARSAAALVRQLMLIARGGDDERRREPFDAVAVAREVLALCRGILRARIEVHARLEPAQVLVDGAETAFHQVLLNMCLNARDALGGRERGRLSISIDLEFRHGPTAPPVMVMRVEDNGQGMSPDQVARLGEPFFTTKAPGVGTGLGLATAYASVRDMGGTIRCESTFGLGTTFFIELPVVDYRWPGDAVGDDARASAPTPGAVPRLDATPRLLLIDDEPAVREALARMLVRRGYEVTQAGNGREGLELAADGDRPFDAVLLDLSMPGLPGERVLEQLARRHPGLPVVVLSGFVEDYDALATAQAILHKPVSGRELDAILSELIKNDEETPQ